MSKLQVKFKKLSPDAKTPTRAHDGEYPDAGYDLYAEHAALLGPGDVVVVRTGIAIELPKVEQHGELFFTYEAQLRPRSGMRLKNIIVSLGTVDSGYRGDMSVVMHNHSRHIHQVKKGDKIAQMVVHAIPLVDLVEVKELTESERGAKGFGSTGDA